MITKTDFILKLTRELLYHNFSIKLINIDNIDGYGGWFSTDEGAEEFVVAMKHHMSFEIFIHEYCHFLQWKYDRNLWNKSMLTYDILFDWIEDKSLNTNNKELDQSLHDIIEIEHDCEKRALKLMDNNSVENFDKIKYIKAINAYLWSYHISREKRVRPKNPIYTPRVLEKMPSIFNKDLSFYLDKTNLTTEIKSALLQEY